MKPTMPTNFDREAASPVRGFARLPIGAGSIPHAVSLFLLLAITGCQTSSVPTATVDPAPVLAGQAKKDKDVLAGADEIDKVAPKAKVHTNAQRAAVAAAPASQVSSLVAEYEAKANADAERIADLSKTIEKLKDAEQKKQVAICRWAGFALLALAAVLVYAKLPPFAIASAVGGFLSLGLAQLLSQPWFTTALNISLGVVAVASLAAAWQAYRRHLATEEKAETHDRYKAAFHRLVPAMDSALKSLSPADSETVQSVLARAMDEDHKKLVKEIRVSL